MGKGARLPEVVEAMKKYHGVYFGAIGGAGALLAKCIKKAELIAYEDLGAEALRRLEVEDMPLLIKRDFFSSCERFTHSLVACVTGGIDGSGKIYGISGMQCFCQFFC